MIDDPPIHETILPGATVSGDGMATVYRRGEVWWVRFQFGGVHIRRSAKTTKRTEAQTYLQRLMDEAAAKGRRDRPRHTFPEAIERYFEEASVKEKTIGCYRTSSRMLAALFNPLYLDEIDRKRIAEYVSARKKGGVSDTTVRRDLAFLSTLCAACLRWDWLDTNPVTASKRGLRESRPRTRYLKQAEYDRLLAVSSPVLRSAIVFAVETGMRKEELFGLTLGAVEMARREAHLERTKTNSPRRVPLSDKALAVIKERLADPERPRSDYIFCKSDGSRFCDMKKAFQAACRRAKVTNFRWHDLRHTCASWWVQRGGDLYKLSRMLGHSSLQMTTRYGHLRVADLHDEVAKVAQYRSQERLIAIEPESQPTP